MSLEHSPARQGARPGAFSIPQFCTAYTISRSALYKLWAAGKGPRWMWVNGRRLITFAAAADWEREGEAEAAAAVAEEANEQRIKSPIPARF